jgi:HK97 family phage prohead protease
MSTQREVRYLVATEVRAVGGSGDADPLRIEGYAATFNNTAQLPGFREEIKPGAFTRAINEKQDVVCLFNHDSNLVLGRTTSGTLRLSSDARGLHYVCDLPNTQAGRDTHESIKRGDINGCSFAFTVPADGQRWSEAQEGDGDYFIKRELVDLDIHDVSPVTYPAYGGTSVYARSTDACEAPAEMRSAVENKNKERRAMMDAKVIDVPPAEAEKIEHRPYKSVDELPDNVPAAHKKQFLEVFNSAHAKAKKDGKSDKDAEASAFAQAWGVINKAEKKSLIRARATEKKCELRDAIIAANAEALEGGEEDCLEDMISEICKAVAAKYPMPGADEKMAGIYGGGRFYVCETYDEYVIVVECSTGEYFAIAYAYVGEECQVGEPRPVEKVWVAADRTKKLVEEFYTAHPELRKKEEDDEMDEFDYDNIEFCAECRAKIATAKKSAIGYKSAPPVVEQAVQPWPAYMTAIAKGALPASEATRFMGPGDQPRNTGKFGTVDAERASSMSEHNYAVRSHMNKAGDAMDAENHSGAMSHLRAAYSHATAARAHKENADERLNASLKAQSISKEANRSY